MKNIKDHFPIFKNHPSLIYLDNASTTQKPKKLMESLSHYYENYNANIGRGLYHLAYLSETHFLHSRQKIAQFFHTDINNLVYTSGSTESLNLAQHIISQISNKKKYIIIPISEHHANIMTWQRLAKEQNLSIYWISNQEELLDPSIISKEITNNTFLVCMSHVSNVSGEIFPIDIWGAFCKQNNIIFVVDGSQAISSLEVNLHLLDVDFYAFSTHKHYGPMGLGILYINNKFLKYEPKNLGGGIIEDVDQDHYTLIDGIDHFQAGTPNVANIYAYSEVLTFLEKQSFFNVVEKQKELYSYLKQELENFPNIKIIEFSSKLNKTSIISFNVNNIHAHDLGTYFANKNIAIRAGKHCTHPFHDFKNVNSTVRVSIGIYNSKKDITIFLKHLKEAIIFFGQ